MSFDFFNPGNKAEQQGCHFTSQQNTFLQTKLPFLDRNNTGSINKGDALSLLKFSGLSGNVLQKIMINSKIDNCQLDSKKNITYDQMKKVFRGISLAQKKLQPSVINIQANIPLKMPIFYDDDQDDQEQQQKHEKPNTHQQQYQQQQQQQQNLQPQKQTSNNHQSQSMQKNKSNASFQPPQIPKHPNQKKQSGTDLFAQFGKTDSPPKRTQSYNQKSLQKAQSDKKIDNPNSDVIKKKDALSQAIQKYQLYWRSIPQLGNKIAGSQVKKISGNSVQKSALAKAWKVCNISEKGYLTKGQYFIFLNLIQECKKNNKLPEHLSHQMKQIIYRIDGIRPQRNQRNSRDARDSGIRVTAPTTLPNQSRQKIQSSENLQTTQPFRQNNSNLHLQSRLANQSRAISQHADQIHSLKISHAQSNRAIDQFQSFLSAIQTKNAEMKNQINQLKANQQNLNGSLNRVFLKMRQVLIKQAQTITDMIQYMHLQNQNNKIRVNTLENYSQGEFDHEQQTKKQYIKQKQQMMGNKNYPPHNQSNRMTSQPNYQHGKEHSISQVPSRPRNQTQYSNQNSYNKNNNLNQPQYQQQQQNPPQNQVYNQNNYNNKNQGRESIQNNIHHNDQNQSETGEQPKQFFFDQPGNQGARHQHANQASPVHNNQYNPPQNHASPNQINNHTQLSPENSYQNQHQHQNQLHHNQLPSQQENHRQKTQEQLQMEQKIKLKQNHVLKMLHYLAPIKPQQAQIVIQKITSMTQQQLNNLYAQLYQKYLIKERQKKQVEDSRISQSQSRMESETTLPASSNVRQSKNEHGNVNHNQNDDFDTKNFTNSPQQGQGGDLDFFA